MTKYWMKWQKKTSHCVFAKVPSLKNRILSALNSLEEFFKRTNQQSPTKPNSQSRRSLTSSSASRGVIGDFDLVLNFAETMNLRRLGSEVSGLPGL